MLFRFLQLTMTGLHKVKELQLVTLMVKETFIVAMVWSETGLSGRIANQSSGRVKRMIGMNNPLAEAIL